jgi:hypothetical protein
MQRNGNMIHFQLPGNFPGPYATMLPYIVFQTIMNLWLCWL